MSLYLFNSVSWPHDKPLPLLIEFASLSQFAKNVLYLLHHDTSIITAMLYMNLYDTWNMLG